MPRETTPPGTLQCPRSRSNSHTTPRTPTTATWTVNLAWEGPVDLDLAAAVFGERGTFLSLVYYANTEAMNRGVVHSGDAKGGQGQSQETITVRPAALDPRATAIVLFARVHDDGASLGSRRMRRRPWSERGWGTSRTYEK